MGIEYRIHFQLNPAELDVDLRALRFFSTFEPEYGLYYLRFDATSLSHQPDAWAKIEPDGLYFCDNGGKAAERAVVFRSIIDLALLRGGNIEVEQL